MTREIKEVLNKIEPNLGNKITKDISNFKIVSLSKDKISFNINGENSLIQLKNPNIDNHFFSYLIGKDISLIDWSIMYMSKERWQTYFKVKEESENFTLWKKKKIKNLSTSVLKKIERYLKQRKKEPVYFFLYHIQEEIKRRS
jgi:hypothetical protein